MRRPFLGNGFASRPSLQRLERACARMNPYLLLVAIGLVLINLIALMAMSPHLPITRHSAGWAPIEAGCQAMSGTEARLMSGT